MEVVRAFNSNELHTEIIIKGTNENPLFRASDIALVLGINNIRMSIKDYNETEKIDDVTITDSIGRNQQVTFLTEKGLYKVLFKSRKPIAEQFQDWVCDVIKEIRLTGQYKLNKEVEELKNQLEEKQVQLELKDTELHQKDHTHFLVNHKKFLQLFSDNKVVYVILLKYVNPTETPNKKYIIKIGKTERLQFRLKEIAVTYMVKDPIILDVYESNNISKLENHIHSHIFLRDLQYEYTTANHKSAKETYIVNDLELNELKSIITKVKDNLPPDIEIDKRIQLEELRFKNNESVRLNNEISLKKLQIIKENNEILCKLKQLETNSTIQPVDTIQEMKVEDEDEDEDEDENENEDEVEDEKKRRTTGTHSS
jgi:prophage antirepressor-like protein